LHTPSEGVAAELHTPSVDKGASDEPSASTVTPINDVDDPSVKLHTPRLGVCKHCGTVAEGCAMTPVQIMIGLDPSIFIEAGVQGVLLLGFTDADDTEGQSYEAPELVKYWLVAGFMERPDNAPDGFVLHRIPQAE